MKTELKILKLITIVFSLLVIFTLVNCNDEKCPYPDSMEHIYYTLSEDTLLIPYTGYETLKFLRMTPSDTDTVIYKGMGRIYYENTETNYDLEPCRETYHYEAYKIKFENQETISSIYDIELKLETFVSSSTEYFINYYKRSFSDVTSLTINYNMYGGYIGSIIFEDQSFSRVSYLQREYNGIKERLYINAYDGIIRFELNEFVLQLIK